jgi:hypothetical protein
MEQKVNKRCWTLNPQPISPKRDLFFTNSNELLTNLEKISKILRLKNVGNHQSQSSDQ